MTPKKRQKLSKYVLRDNKTEQENSEIIISWTLGTFVLILFLICIISPSAHKGNVALSLFL